MHEELLDTSALAGFSFACRPDCGLCCFAEPVVSPGERTRLVQLVPAVEFSPRGKFEFVRSHPDGGACTLLTDHRCRAHSARPSPCREYPLAGHVGTRLQAVVVLTCPGIDIASLEGYAGPQNAPAGRGFDLELAALRCRADASVLRRLEQSRRRRNQILRALARRGRWVDEEDVRRELRGRFPLPIDEGYPGDPPPPTSEGLDLLPLVFDGRNGPIALAGRPEGWELLELQASGGVRARLGVLPPPSRQPDLSRQAERILQGYLRYWLERDQLFGTVHLDMIEDGEGVVTDRIASEVRRIGVTAVSRAHVLAALLRGNVGELSGPDLIQGIRATDQDLLDRPTWGSRL